MSSFARSRRIELLVEQLRAAGHPVVGAARPSGVLRLDFQAGATPTQQSAAYSAAAPFDFTPRRRRVYATLMSEIASLSNADRQKLINAVLADFLREHPRFAALFSISITGDEPDA